MVAQLVYCSNPMEEMMAAMMVFEKDLFAVVGKGKQLGKMSVAKWVNWAYNSVVWKVVQLVLRTDDCEACNSVVVMEKLTVVFLVAEWEITQDAKTAVSLVGWTEILQAALMKVEK